MGCRGTRRILEKKKYKCLGEISCLSLILEDTRKRLIQRISQQATKRVKVAVAEATSHGMYGMGGGMAGMGGLGLDSPRSNHEPVVVEEEKKHSEHLTSLIPENDWFY